MESTVEVGLLNLGLILRSGGDRHLRGRLRLLRGAAGGAAAQAFSLVTTGLAAVGVIGHTAYLVTRWIAAGRIEILLRERSGDVLTGVDRLWFMLSHPPYTNLFDALNLRRLGLDGLLPDRRAPLGSARGRRARGRAGPGRDGRGRAGLRQADRAARPRAAELLDPHPRRDALRQLLALHARRGLRTFIFGANRHTERGDGRGASGGRARCFLALVGGAQAARCTCNLRDGAGLGPSRCPARSARAACST